MSRSTSRIRHALHPHSHEAAAGTAAVQGAGLRVLWVSAAALGVTALAQAAVVAMSGSVALLSDTLHNAIDALSVVALIGLAGNELVARYRTSAGRKIGSAALVADGPQPRGGADYHAALATHR